MSASGQKQTYAPQKAMSALPPIATAKVDIRKRSCLLYPRKQTCAPHKLMSELGHKRTFQLIGLQRLSSGDACNARIDFAAKCPEIDGLGEKRFGPTLQRLALGLGVAISGDHNDRYIGS